MNNIWLALITGLTTGGISCLAVQGGLLASCISSDQKTELVSTKKWQKVGMFLVAKIIGYTLLGFGLGFLGSSLILTPKILGWMQILAGLFMLITAAQLLDLHPIFRRFTLRPPKWAYRLAKDKSKSKEFFAPALLGFLTVLIPCGVTQAMMTLAVTTANPLYGAGIMSAFTIGTSPVFFALGITTVKLLEKKAFVYLASLTIFALGLASINTGQILKGSPHTLGNYWKALTDPNTSTGPLAKIINGKQQVSLIATSNGYKSDIKKLKVGVPVELTISSKNVVSCAKSFLIPSLNVAKILPKDGNTVIEFIPKKLGNLSYTCGMGMYTGNFTVVN